MLRLGIKVLRVLDTTESCDSAIRSQTAYKEAGTGCLRLFELLDRYYVYRVSEVEAVSGFLIHVEKLKQERRIERSHPKISCNFCNLFCK